MILDITLNEEVVKSKKSVVGLRDGDNTTVFVAFISTYRGVQNECVQLNWDKKGFGGHPEFDSVSSSVF